MMEETSRNRRSVGCFGFWRLNKSRKKTHPATATCSRHTETASATAAANDRSDVDSLVDRDLNSGALDTFALCQMEKKSDCRTRVVMRPYFGKFAGQWLTFDLRRNESMDSIKVKVEEHPITTLYQRNSSRVVDCTRSIRDRCLLFAHDVRNSRETEELELLKREPLSLSFLCERTILLHVGDLPISQLPPKYNCLFSASGSQDLKVRVWPKQVSVGATTIRMLLKPRISVRELQWMLCKRLSVPNPLSIALYVLDSLESLPVNASIERGLSQVECIVQPSLPRRRDESLLLAVSVIGIGVKDVEVHPSMTLCEFEGAVREQFSMKCDSFLYMPQIYKSRKSTQWGLKMTALIDDATVSLIDPKNRSFPVVDGIPSLQIRKKYQQLPVYQTSIDDLQLLKSSPVIAFEVAGPTIPIAFKTMNVSSHNSVFAVVLVKPHVVSVNQHWTIATLLKYIESISGFPCEQICIGDTVLEPTSFVAERLVQCWLLKTKSGRIGLPNEIPYVTPL